MYIIVTEVGPVHIPSEIDRQGAASVDVYVAQQIKKLTKPTLSPRKE